jgi:hypothetical protein
VQYTSSTPVPATPWWTISATGVLLLWSASRLLGKKRAVAQPEIAA